MRICGTEAAAPWYQCWKIHWVWDNQETVVDSELTGFERLLLRGILNARGLLQYPALNKSKREPLQPRAPLLHAPAIQCAEGPNYVGNATALGAKGRHNRYKGEQRVNVDDIEFRDPPQKPSCKRPGKSVKTGLTWKDPIGNTRFHQGCAPGHGETIRAVVIRCSYVNFETTRSLPPRHSANDHARSAAGKTYRRNYVQHTKGFVRRRSFQSFRHQVCRTIPLFGFGSARKKTGVVAARNQRYRVVREALNLRADTSSFPPIWQCGSERRESQFRHPQ